MNWTEVVTNPLGLIAFTLALLFGVVGKVAAKQKPWFLKLATALAAFVIVGGLYLSYLDVQGKAKSITMPDKLEKQKPPMTGSIQQNTRGDQSPAIQGAQGNVIIIQNKGAGDK